MTLVAYIGGSDQAHRVRLRDIGVTMRADGSVGRGGIIFDDFDKSLTIRGWQKVVIQETACTSAPVLFSGYIGPRRTSRAGSGDVPYGSDGARFIDCDLLDENAVFHIRLITGVDGKRPAETSYERITWDLDSSYMDGLWENDTYVDASSSPFEDADYRGEFSDDVLADISAPVHRIFFMYLEGDGTRSPFYAPADTSVGTCPISISNDLSDITLVDGIVTGDIYPPFNDAVLEQDPTDVVSLIRYVWTGGVTVRTNDATLSEFFTDNGLGHRGLNVENSRVGRQTTAEAKADAMLARESTERETMTCTVMVPKERVGEIRAGQSIPAKLIHLDGYEDFNETRISGVTYKQGINTDWYLVDLELDDHGLIGGGGGGAPGTGGFPAPPPGTTTHYASGHIEYMSEGYGDSGGAGATTPGVPNSTTAVTGDATVTLVLGVTYNYHFLHTLNTLDLDTSHQVGLNDGGTWNPSGPHISTPGGDTTVLYEGSFTCTSGNAGTHSIAASAAGASHVAKAAAMDWWIDPDGWDTGDSPVPPQPGQPVENDTVTPAPDGSTTVFTTNTGNAYADRSLHVEMNGVELESGVDFTESDAASGEVTFTNALPTGAEIVLWYLGR